MLSVYAGTHIFHEIFTNLNTSKMERKLDIIIDRLIAAVLFVGNSCVVCISDHSDTVSVLRLICNGRRSNSSTKEFDRHDNTYQFPTLIVDV